jgi:hypothetical protein
MIVSLETAWMSRMSRVAQDPSEDYIQYTHLTEVLHGALSVLPLTGAIR